MRTLTKYTGFLAKIHSFALIFSFFFIGATPQITKAFAQPEGERKKVLQAPLTPVALEGEFIVQFHSDNSLNAIKKGNNPKWIKKLGDDVQIDTKLSSFRIAHIRVTNPAGDGNWENLANILSSDPDVYAVEPNYLYYANQTQPAIPNDPLINQMWFLDKIQAFESWSYSGKAEDIIVAVIDTGIKFDHEDLKGHIWINKQEIPDNNIDDDKNGLIDDIVGWNFYEFNNWPAPVAYNKPIRIAGGGCREGTEGTYFNKHGTHVAGTIAAVGNNAKGIKGIAENVKIMPIKVLGSGCGHGTSTAILHGLIYAYDKGAHIINMSLGGFAKSAIAQNVYENIASKGVLVVAAAGNETVDNDGTPRSYPASYPFDAILSVAATTPTDQLADFSNWGRKNVDIAAPGVNIMSTIPNANGNNPKPVDGYETVSGTSMAAPIVSGAAAMVWAQNPNLTNLQIKQILMESVDPVAALNTKIASGGRLNLHQALTHRPQIAKAPKKPNSHKAANYSTDNSIGGIRIYDHRNRE